MFLKKRILFPLLPLALILITATVLLTVAEDSEVIETIRQDDRVAYEKGVFLSESEEGKYYIIQHAPFDNAFMLENRVAVHKPKNTYRILITGGSFAMGDPYVDPMKETPGFGDIGSWLGGILKRQYPSLNFEVINAAAGGQNSGLVAQIVGEVVRIKPDLLIVATGNNEGYVPPTRFNKVMHQWIVYRALKKAIKPDPSPEQRLFFPPQDPDTKRITDQFKANIESMAYAAKDSNVPIAFCTMPINLTWDGPNPTGMGQAAEEPENDPHINRGSEELKKGNYKQAIEHFAKSENQAYAARNIALCYQALGQFDLALEFFKIHVEQNPKGRTRPSLNVIIRDIARDEKSLLFDLETALENASDDGIPDSGLFFDNCHMTWQGYLAMARYIADSANNAGIIPGKTDEPLAQPSTIEMIKVNKWDALNSFNPPKWWEFIEQ